MVKRPNGKAEIIATFGDPRPYIDRPAAWESKILSLKTLPQPLIYGDGVTPITRIRAHKLVIDDLIDILMECRAKVGPKRVKFGGCYAFRLKRGASSISTHTWGIAVDIEPVENPMGRKWKAGARTLDLRVIDTFLAHGWEWGGDWSSPDVMHFQYCSRY